MTRFGGLGGLGRFAGDFNSIYSMDDVWKENLPKELPLIFPYSSRPS